MPLPILAAKGAMMAARSPAARRMAMRGARRVARDPRMRQWPSPDGPCRQPARSADDALRVVPRVSRRCVMPPVVIRMSAGVRWKCVPWPRVERCAKLAWCICTRVSVWSR